MVWWFVTATKFLIIIFYLSLFLVLRTLTFIHCHIILLHFNVFSFGRKQDVCKSEFMYFIKFYAYYKNMFLDYKNTLT